MDPSGLQQRKLSPTPAPRKQSNITAPPAATNDSCVAFFGSVTPSSGLNDQPTLVDPPATNITISCTCDPLCFDIRIGVGGPPPTGLPGQTVAAGGSTSYVPFTYFCNASTPCLPEAYIQLSLSGQPADWVQSATAIPGRTTYSFNPPNVYPSQQQSSTLTIRTDASTPPNIYNLTIGGTTINGPSGVRSMPTSLTVTPSTTPPNTPSISTVSSFSAQVGQTVTLTGNNLGSATEVWFGGVPAAFTANVSTNQVTATIPPNAPTAPISVVTASGTTQTAQNFVPTNVPTAPRRAQFNLGVAAGQLRNAIVDFPGVRGFATFTSGAYDFASFGLTAALRGGLNSLTQVSDPINTSSGLYRAGQVAGLAASFVLGTGEAGLIAEVEEGVSGIGRVAEVVGGRTRPSFYVTPGGTVVPSVTPAGIEVSAEAAFRLGEGRFNEALTLENLDVLIERGEKFIEDNGNLVRRLPASGVGVPSRSGRSFIEAILDPIGRRIITIIRRQRPLPPGRFTQVNP